MSKYSDAEMSEFVELMKQILEEHGIPPTVLNVYRLNSFLSDWAKLLER